jgi:hypothetical protein
MDPFHEGEHLTPAYLMTSGERPYRDFFVLHGLGTDGGLDAFVLGDPPSAKRTRRLQTVLDAATLALLVPIAAEVTATSAGLLAAVIAALSASAALWVPVFPYFRLAPVLLAVLGLLRYVRGGRAAPLFLAMAAAALGLLWSVDTGTYALAGTAATFVAIRLAKVEARPLPLARVVVLAAFALALPAVVLVATRADLRLFVRDSFVVIPSAIDAVWALPAPKPLTAAGLRYYLPPVFYGFLLALALHVMRRGDRIAAGRIAIVAIFSILLFRTAAGRVSWSHTRFATILLGIALVAFVLEPLLIARRRVAAVLVAIPLIAYLEIAQNFAAGAKLLASWPSRQRPAGLVPHPLVRGIYTSQENAAELMTLARTIDSLGPGTVLDFTNERVLYLLLRRQPPIRAFDIPMLSAPPLLAEAMAELSARPPVAVILGGDPAVSTFDGLSNRDRVPDLAAWIDANYPGRIEAGRFVVATR